MHNYYRLMTRQNYKTIGKISLTPPAIRKGLAPPPVILKLLGGRMPPCTCWDFDSSKCTKIFTPWQLCAAVMRSKTSVTFFCWVSPLHIHCVSESLLLHGQKRAVLRKACQHLVINKPISGCVRMACDSLLTTSLLQVVNRLDASWFSKLVIHRLDAICFDKL